jgi:hypothetical protein
MEIEAYKGLLNITKIRGDAQCSPNMKRIASSLAQSREVTNPHDDNQIDYHSRR